MAARLGQKRLRPVAATWKGASAGEPRRKSGSIARLKSGWDSWFRAKNPILLFALVFGLLIAAFYGVTLTPLFKTRLFPSYLRFNAQVSNGILTLLGQGSSVFGTSISSGKFSIDVRRGCDAVEPTALFMAAVLAFPAPWRRKLPGLLAGAIVLAILNLVRIISLFLVGVYFPKTFELMHGEVWQAAFILLAIGLWALWIQWATRPRSPAPDVSA